MAQTKSEFDKLLKCLRMTEASNDAEALAAMRRANVVLKNLGWTWDQLLHKKLVVVADPFASNTGPTFTPAPSQPKPAPAPNYSSYARPQPQPTSWSASTPPPPQPDPAPRSYYYGGTTTGRASSKNPNFTPKPRQARKVAAGNITLDDLGL